MTSEDRYNQEVWFVLSKIKKYSYYPKKGDDCEYRIIGSPNFAEQGMPFPVEESRIINKLEELGAIKLKDPNGRLETAEIEEGLDRSMNVFIAIMYLEILQQKFDEIYKKYQKLALEVKDKVVTDYNSKKEFKPLKWDSQKFEVQWMGEPKNISSLWAVTVFLNVMSSIKWIKGIELTANDLADSYNEFYAETKNNKHPKVLQGDQAMRAAGRALKQLHSILSVSDINEFPIRRQGSVRKGKWKWVQPRQSKH